MKFSYNWLKQFVDIDKTPQELADDLSCKSVEINSIERFGGDFLEQVVVGEIKEINPHPDADKLRLTKIDVGAIHESPVQIVCGAPNIEVGQKVPVALVGCKLPMGEIKEAKIRGVESFGMLCAEDELQLGSDHTGIMVLDPSSKVGDKLSDIYNDWVLDGEILPNRGDLQNHFGLAREVSAIYDIPLKENDVIIKNKENKVKDFIEVENKDISICRTYMARMVKNVKLGPSPVWMQQRLLAAGMRPINNVVDITNYVMLEYGNPLHAFDALRISTNSTQIDTNNKIKIIVRLTNKGEKIKTLDGKEHELPEGLLVIANEKEPIAVAGVMGGENSEIYESTKDVILESASFNPQLIRKSQRELGIRTEASSRFEKNLTPYLAFISLDRAAKLMEEVCGGKIVEGVASEFIIQKVKPNIVAVDMDKVKNYLSIDIKDKQILNILNKLGIKKVDTANEKDLEIIKIAGIDLDKIGKNTFLFRPPLWRNDVNIWQDIAEEIGRIYGYDRVPEGELKLQIEPKTEKVLYFEQSAKKFLVELGLTEVFSYSILSKELVEKTQMKDNFFEVINPLNEYDSVIRGGLWSGLLQYTAENSKKFEKFSLFDLSKVYLPGGSTSTREVEPPSKETRMLAILVYGEKDEEGLFVLKKHFADFGNNFALTFDFKNAQTPMINDQYIHPGRCAEILFNDQKIGQIFEIHPIVLENLDIKKRVWIGAVNIEKLASDVKNVDNKFAENESNVIFKDFSRFEVSKRDMAVIIDEKLTSQEIIDEITKIDDKIIGAELFDEFKSDKFGAGKKSLAFHLVFQAPDHTLNDEETEGLFNKIVAQITKKFKAELRK